VTAEPLSLASLRYAEVTVDISECDTPASVDDTTLNALRSDLKSRVAEMPTLEHVVYRLTYEGRTRLHQTLDEQAQAMIEDLAPSFEGTTSALDTVSFNTEPDHDLEALAEGNDPPGVIAQRLLTLQKDDISDEPAQRLLKEAARASDTVYNASGYAALQRDKATDAARPGDESLRDMLIQQGLRLLDKLLEQRSSPA